MTAAPNFSETSTVALRAIVESAATSGIAHPEYLACAFAAQAELARRGEPWTPAR